MSEREDILKKYFAQTQGQPSLLSREDARSILNQAGSAPKTRKHLPGTRSIVATLAVSAVAVLTFLYIVDSSDNASENIAERSADAVATTSGPESNSRVPAEIRRSLQGETGQAVVPPVSGNRHNSLIAEVATSPISARAETFVAPVPVAPVSFTEILPEEIEADGMRNIGEASIGSLGSIASPAELPSLGYRVATPQLTSLPETALIPEGITVTRLNTVSTPDYDDYNPMISTDGRTLYFISNREHGLGGHDFWKAIKQNREDLSFSEPHNLGSGINTSRNEGAASMASDGQTMYFTGCDRPGCEGGCDIYEAALKEGGWVEVRNLREINSAYWEGHPTVSADGRAIYFVSNRPGSLGNHDDADIYVSYKQPDGTWSHPENLGRPVNTTKMEDSPFIAPGGDALYFSSAGHEGFGKLDFFVSHRNPDGTWGEPENLGPEFNTPNDERFITLPAAEDIVYFASSDGTGNGNLDLYMARRQTRSSSVVVNGSIRREGSDQQLAASLLFVDGMTGEVLSGTATNEETGEFSFVLGNNSFERVVDVYGYSDSLGEFRSQIFLPAGHSYLEYRCDLVVQEPTATTAGNWNPTLSISSVDRPDLVTVRSARDRDERMIILDAWGHHLVDTVLKAQSYQTFDLSGVPDGLYLARTESSSGIVAIRRKEATGSSEN